jgi:flavin reductase (DIM6/NTAB) family NADH-FMN oxidoreductase RutF
MIALSNSAINFQAFKRSRDALSASAQYPEALRRIPRGVSLLTFIVDDERFGLTATSVSSLSRDPPAILVSVERRSPIGAGFLRCASFGISILSAEDDALAERFSGGAAISEKERRHEQVWATSSSGLPFLTGAAAALDCERDDVMDYHGAAIVVGRVRSVRALGKSSALLCWGGAYNRLGWTDEEIARAVGLPCPAAR